MSTSRRCARRTRTVEAFFAQKVDITDAKEREAQLAHYVSDAEWLGRIRDALDDDRMVLYWQPILDLRTGETVQHELLLRLRDEDGTIVAPGEFLPIAERYGLISEIDRWVIRQAVPLAARGIPVEFNISATSLSDPYILRELAEAIEETGADPSLLVVEVTETAMLDEDGSAEKFADDLRALGCELAIDDFGTGFASLSQLKHLHSGHLKIDIEFVRDIAENETDQRLVRGIVGLARELEQTTIAEGVENEQALTKLRELGVDRAQGYLFARPSPIVDREPVKPTSFRSAEGCADPIATVRAVFEAFAARDLEALRRLCHPDVVIRLPATSKRANHDGAYRGQDGLERYFYDLAEVWDDLRVQPSAFWETNGTVIVFGRVTAVSDGHATVTEALWIYRLRGDQIIKLEAFPQSATAVGKG